MTSKECSGAPKGGTDHGGGQSYLKAPWRVLRRFQEHSHFILDDENDTIGNILQSHIVNNITDDTLITFCGYKKIHPLEEKIKLVIFNKLLNDIDELSIVSKVIFSISDNIDEIVNILEEMIEKSKSI